MLLWLWGEHHTAKALGELAKATPSAQFLVGIWEMHYNSLLLYLNEPACLNYIATIAPVLEAKSLRRTPPHLKSACRSFFCWAGQGRGEGGHGAKPFRSAAPRPRCGPAPCGVPDKNISQGSRSRAARWVLRSKPLPLAGRTNRKRRQHRSRPIFYSVFFCLGAPKPSKTRGP